MPSVLNLFFFRTECEAICSCLIANNNKKQGKNCIFFSYEYKPYNVAKKMSRVPTVLWEKKTRGPFERTAEIKYQIKQICKEVKNHTKVIIHIGQLSPSRVNYYIRHIIDNYPHIELVVHAIPHGLKEQRLKKLSVWKQKKMKIKNCMKRISGLPLFYDRIYDSYGFLSPITEKIYVFPGFEKEVKKYHRNVEALPLSKGTGNKNKDVQNKMLIIGQKNIGGFHITEEQVLHVTQKIITTAHENGISQIDYLPHPRRKAALELYDESFNMIETSYSAEILVIDNGYKIVASFTTTGLVFSKMLSGDSATRFISFGANLSTRQEELHDILLVMRRMGIEIIDV